MIFSILSSLTINLRGKMARPSNQDQRKEEILKAYELCVSLYGVQGATLKVVAEKAKLARPLLRHHVGNSDELLMMSLDRFLSRSQSSLNELLDYLEEQKNPKALLEALFYYENSENETTDILIAWAFMLGAQTNPTLKGKMNNWLVEFRAAIVGYLSHSFPKSSKKKVEVITDGILAIYYNIESTTPLFNVPDIRENSFSAANLLLDSLEV